MKFDHKKLKKLDNSKAVALGWDNWVEYEPIELSDGKKIYISENKKGELSINVEDKYGRKTHIEDYCISMKWTDSKSDFVQDEAINWDKVLEGDVNSGFFEYFFDSESLKEDKWCLNEIAVLYGPPKNKESLWGPLGTEEGEFDGNA